MNCSLECELDNGHIIVSGDNGRYLIDTGSPINGGISNGFEFLQNRETI